MLFALLLYLKDWCEHVGVIQFLDFVVSARYLSDIAVFDAPQEYLFGKYVGWLPMVGAPYLGGGA